jgi:hypothetical protein
MKARLHLNFLGKHDFDRRCGFCHSALLWPRRMVGLCHLGIQTST